ncbi:class I SAM-dependent methyltransferase [Acidobacteria bacterium ACD]|nr:class I SAM-dependent methyltransferase [Acidobacteria bacterium ACD]
MRALLSRFFSRAGLGPRALRAISGGVVDEHFVPGDLAGDPLDIGPALADDDARSVHHLIRYAWAREVLGEADPPGSILDVACGDGYGSYALAQRLPSARVLGVDYDAGAVEAARARYRLPNLEFRVGDGTRWDETIGAGVFDVVVSFDTLEHVAHREVFLENLVAHLRPEGRLLFSTPCGADVNDLSPAWEHHRIEYSAGSLYDLLRRYFEVIRRPDDGSLPREDVFDRLRGSNVDYLLRMNPLVCERPVVVENPYPSALRRSRGFQGTV